MELALHVLNYFHFEFIPQYALTVTGADVILRIDKARADASRTYYGAVGKHFYSCLAVHLVFRATHSLFIAAEIHPHCVGAPTIRVQRTHWTGDWGGEA